MNMQQIKHENHDKSTSKKFLKQLYKISTNNRKIYNDNLD